MKKIIYCILLLAMLLSFAGCRESDKVSYNISKEADAFNVVRRLTVLNVRSDAVMMQLEGTFSLSNNSVNELVVVCKTGDNEYKKHYVYLNEWTAYTVEDISGSDVDPYNYEITFYPQMLKGVNIEIAETEENKHGFGG